MSFSKARIQRFNDITSEAPPPGAYDPKFDSKVKGVAIEKKERFQDSKSVTSSGGECNSSVSSKGAARALSSPKFRTPQLPKKLTVKSQNTSCPKAKTKLLLGTSKDLKYDARHELADLKVECVNKDRTITDHANQIEEMKRENWRLEKKIEEMMAKQTEAEKIEKQLADLRVTQSEVEEQYKKDLESMAELQKEILDAQELKHAEETELLLSQLSQMTEAIEKEVARQEGTAAIVEENMLKMESELRSEVDRLTSRLAEVVLAKDREIEDLMSLIREKEKELSSVREEFEELKIVSDDMRQKLSSLQSDGNDEVVFLRNVVENLRSQVYNMVTSRSEVESKLETRQQVVLELQSQLSTVQCELDELRAEYERMSSESEAKITEIINCRDRELIDMRHDFIRERERMENDKLIEITRRLESESENKMLSETNAFLTEELQDVQKLYKEANRSRKEIQNEVDELKEKHAKELKDIQERLESIKNHYTAEQERFERLLENARLDYIREIDNMTEARNKELEELKSTTDRTIEEETRRIQERADKIVENAEAVTRETLAACRAESEERVKRVIAESDAKLKCMVRDARNAVEKEMREAADRYAAQIAELESEKSELEKKVSQRDDELVKLSVALEELKIVVENQESFSQSLQADLDRVEGELAERKDELRTLKDQIRAEGAEMVARRRKMEVVMAENQATVAALSQKLSESNAEVERLQSVIKAGEESINEHRSFLNARCNTSKILTKEVHTLMEELDAHKADVERLEADNLADIESMRNLLLHEIEQFKSTCIEKMKELEESNKKKDEQNVELKKHLDAMASKVDEVQGVLLKMEELEDTRAIVISQLELDNEKFAQELKTTKEANAALKSKDAASELAIQEAKTKIDELTARLEVLETDRSEKKTMINVNEQLETRLKDEIARRKALEGEVLKLSEDCENVRKSYQEVSEKYAEVLGHHNHKQRVKHLNQLKDKIIRLEKDAETKKHIIDQQSKTIEKLRAEEKRSFAKGKENLHSHGLSRSPYTTPASSPLKPLTPLRDRNE